MPRYPILALFALVAGCGQRPPPTPVVIAVEPPKIDVAPTPTPIKPEPPQLVTLPADAGGGVVGAFLAPRDLGDLSAKPVSKPVPAPAMRFEAPLPAATVSLPEVKPNLPPPLLRQRVGPRTPPEPEPPMALAPNRDDYILSPRAIELWRLPPSADPLAPPPVPPTPRRELARTHLPNPSATLASKRVADRVPGCRRCRVSL